MANLEFLTKEQAQNHRLRDKLVFTSWLEVGQGWIYRTPILRDIANSKTVEPKDSVYRLTLMPFNPFWASRI